MGNQSSSLSNHDGDTSERRRANIKSKQGRRKHQRKSISSNSSNNNKTGASTGSANNKRPPRALNKPSSGKSNSGPSQDSNGRAITTKSGGSSSRGRGGFKVSVEHDDKLEPLDLVGGNVSIINKVQGNNNKAQKIPANSPTNLPPLVAAAAADQATNPKPSGSINQKPLKPPPVDGEVPGLNTGAAEDKEDEIRVDSTATVEETGLKLDHSLGANSARSKGCGPITMTKSPSTIKATPATLATSSQASTGSKAQKQMIRGSSNNQIRENGPRHQLSKGTKVLGQKVAMPGGDTTSNNNNKTIPMKVGTQSASGDSSQSRQPVERMKGENKPTISRNGRPVKVADGVFIPESTKSPRAAMSMMMQPAAIKQPQLAGPALSLNLRLNQVEDQRQRVRNWLNSQPFTEKQSKLEMEEEEKTWTVGGKASELTMLNTDHHSKPNTNTTKTTTKTTTKYDVNKGKDAGHVAAAATAGRPKTAKEQEHNQMETRQKKTPASGRQLDHDDLAADGQRIHKDFHTNQVGQEQSDAVASAEVGGPDSSSGIDKQRAPMTGAIGGPSKGAGSPEEEEEEEEGQRGGGAAGDGQGDGGSISGGGGSIESKLAISLSMGGSQNNVTATSGGINPLGSQDGNNNNNNHAEGGRSMIKKAAAVGEEEQQQKEKEKPMKGDHLVETGTGLLTTTPTEMAGHRDCGSDDNGSQKQASRWARDGQEVVESDFTDSDLAKPQSSLGETVAPDMEDEDEDEIVDQQCCCSSSSLDEFANNAAGNDEGGYKQEAAKCVKAESAATVASSSCSADMQRMDFKKLPQAESATMAAAAASPDDCSLCHYLVCLKAIASSQSGDSANPVVVDGVCSHHQTSSDQGMQKHTDVLASLTGETSIWSDMKLDRNELKCVELKADGLLVGAVMDKADDEGTTNQMDEDEDEEDEQEKLDEYDSSDFDRASAARASSAHSRLCPNEEGQDLIGSDSLCGAQELVALPPSHDIQVAGGKDYRKGCVDVDEGDEMSSTGPPMPRPLPQSQNRSSAARGLQQIQRGLSLDAKNTKPHASSHRRQLLKRMNSKQGLSKYRHSSQSSKLILISSSSVAYTIQVATEDSSLSIDDDIEDQNYRKTICNTSGAKEDNNHNVNSSNGELVDLKYKPSSFQSNESKKKFLVKKISGPNPRAALIKRQLADHHRRDSHQTGIKTRLAADRFVAGADQSTTARNSKLNQYQSTISNQAESLSSASTTTNKLTSTETAAAIMDDTNRDNNDLADQGAGDLTPTADDAQQEHGRPMSRSPESSGSERLVGRSRDRKSNVRGGANDDDDGSGGRPGNMDLESIGMNFNVGPMLDSESRANFADDTNKTCNLAAKRLRELVAHLEHGSVPQSVLYQTLEYAASVLDSVTMDQISRVSDEEDGDLSEVQSDAVPNEVRKWLETTFTRNSISQKRKSEDKLKFRSVANAIRAGIVVDRIYRRMSATTPFVSAELSNLLKSIDDWSFDCFSINQISNGQVLKSVGYELFNRYGLMYKFKIPTTVLKNFLTQIESGYVKHKNPYHNNLHAADVTQTVHHMLWQAGLTNWLTDLEIFATLLAAIIHDYLHTGTTNNFHVMSKSDTALIYNDRAVLENFHICQAFTLMRNEDCNILAGLSKDEYREFRSLVIDMVLATDMSSHFQQIKAMKNILNHSDNFNADKSKILSLVIHISDISHPAKEWELHSQWTQFLMEEFFRQGDREKELALECSPLCDRETTLVAESQLGFIEFIVSPSLEVCGDVLDRVLYQMAEANARPVLPASAKAASVVAAAAAAASSASGSGNQQQQTAAIEPAPMGPASLEQHPSSTTTTTTTTLGEVREVGRGQSSLGGETRAASATSGASTANNLQSSLAASFVSSETLTSNLRKMIVSSSATIGRKLNISGSNNSPSSSSSGASTHQAPSNRQQQQPQLTRLPADTGSAHAAAAAASNASDFEIRQANYKHPVIQCDSSIISRPQSSDPRVRQQQQQQSDTRSERKNDPVAPVSGPSGPTTEIATLDQAPGRQQLTSLQQPGEMGPNNNSISKRPSSSALTTCGQSSRSSPQLQIVKIQRPWIKCLDRNKKMWQERAVKDAQARELKERLKQQQQIDSTDDLKQVEDEPSEPEPST